MQKFFLWDNEASSIHPTGMHSCYRPPVAKRAKVIFSQESVWSKSGGGGREVGGQVTTPPPWATPPSPPPPGTRSQHLPLPPGQHLLVVVVCVLLTHFCFNVRLFSQVCFICFIVRLF